MSRFPSFLKRVDRLFRRLFLRIVPPPRQRRSDEPRSLLVIRPGGIGDAVLLVPVLRALKRGRPDVVIHVLAESRNAAAFDFCPEVEKVFRYDRLPELWKAVSGSYDAVVDTEQWYVLSAVVGRLVGAKISYGFATNERARLFTHPIPYSLDAHETDNFFSLLGPLGVAGEKVGDEPFLEIPSGSRSAEVLLAGSIEAPYCVIFPGASVPEKQWGVDKFRDVVAEICAMGVGLLVVGGAKERALGDEIVEGTSGLNLAGSLSLVETGQVLRDALFLLSGDSGVLHIGWGLGTPTISVFGPSDPVKWRPRGDQHVVVSAGLPCAPCSSFGTVPTCQRGVECLEAISSAEVVASIKEVLSEIGRYREPNA